MEPEKKKPIRSTKGRRRKLRPLDLCPHGNQIGECDACDRDADQAFDSAREDRTFGRDR